MQFELYSHNSKSNIVQLITKRNWFIPIVFLRTKFPVLVLISFRNSLKMHDQRKNFSRELMLIYWESLFCVFKGIFSSTFKIEKGRCVINLILPFDDYQIPWLCQYSDDSGLAGPSKKMILLIWNNRCKIKKIVKFTKS